MRIATLVFAPLAPRARPASRRGSAATGSGAVLLGSLLALAGCGGEGGEEDQVLPSYPIETAIEGAILPSVEGFSAASSRFERAVGAFCSGPSTSTLEGARAEWRDLSLAWNRLVLYDFGPLDDDLIVPTIYWVESMRQRGIDYTADVREELDAALTSSASLDAAYFEGLRFNEVGLLALEILLFESSAPGRPQGLDAVLSDYRRQGRKCTYLQGITGLLVARAEGVERGWTESFEGGDPFARQFRRERLDDGSEPLARLFTAVSEHLVYVARRKLEGLLDAQLSGLFYENVGSTLDELELLLEGGDGGAGMASVLRARGAGAAAESARSSLRAARASARAEDRMGLVMPLRALASDFGSAIPQGLGVQLSLNFADGD